MKLKLSLRCIAALLTIAILATTLPLVLVAEGLAPEDELRNLGELTEKEEAAPPSLIDPYEEISLREGNVKHFRLEDGSYVAVQYPSLVHTQDADGNWVDINNHLSASGSEYTSENAKIKLVKKITGNGSIFTIHKGNHKIELSLSGAIKKTEGALYNTETEFDESATTLQKMMTLDNLSARVVYADILSGVDLEYLIDGLHIKENLYIKEKNDTYSYTFILKLNNLEAELLEDGSVRIFDPDTDENIYIIPRGYMFDANGASSTAVSYALASQGNGKYTLTVTPDADWINAEGRAFPVCVDPPLLSVEASSYEGTHISTASPNANYASATNLTVGYQTISFVKATLPTLPSDAYIYDACLTAETIMQVGSTLLIRAHKVTTEWSSSALTYTNFAEGLNGNYHAIYSGVVVPSHTLEEKTWNITGIVKEWYSTVSPNYGVALVASTWNDSVESSAIIKKDTLCLCIGYYRLSGIENYWAYSQASAGLAGTGYINLATGGLTFALDTMSCTDSLFGYTPTLVYNQYMAGKSYTKIQANTCYLTPSAGYGFMFSFDQSIVAGEDADGNPATIDSYIWLDGDGTEHTFVPVKKDNQITHYSDVDGLQLKLHVEDNGFRITDATENAFVMHFDSYSSNSLASGGACLSYIGDNVGNQLVFARNATNKVTQIKIISSLNERIEFLQFQYNSHGLVRSVAYPNTNTSMVFKYSNPVLPEASETNYGYLSEIEYRWFDGTTAKCNYQYDSTGKLISVQDAKQECKIQYTYTGNQITSAEEYLHENTIVSQKLTFVYRANATEVCSGGVDVIFGNSDDVFTIYVFDNEGRATSVYSTDVSRTQFWGGIGTTYSNKIASKNSISSTFDFGGSSINYLHNGGFEKTQSALTAPFESWETSLGVFARSTDTLSANCVQMLLSANTTRYLSQNVYLSEGQHTFSVNTENANIPNASMHLIVSSATDSTISFSKEISINEMTIVDGRYTASLSFVIETAGMYQAKIQVVCSSTISPNQHVYFDNAMLVRGSSVGNPNMVEYGSFDDYSGETNAATRVKSAWGIASGIDNSPQTGEGAFFGKVLHLNSEIETAEQVIFSRTSQNLTNAQLTTAPIYTLAFSGMAKGSGQNFGSGCHFELVLRITYQVPSSTAPSGYTSEVVEYAIPFLRDSVDWQYGFKCITTAGYYISRIAIACIYENQPGDAYFDQIYVNMSPEKDFGQTWYDDAGRVFKTKTGNYSTYYVYDENGRLDTTFDSEHNISCYEYDFNGNVVGILQGERTCSIHQDNSCLESQAVCELYQIEIKQKTVYSYNYYGQSTGTATAYGSVDADGNFEKLEGCPFISFHYEYVQNSSSKIIGALIEETNTNGQTTRYFYNEDYGWLLAAIEPDGTGTAYAYDGAGNIVGVYAVTYSSELGEYEQAEAANRAEYTYDDTMRLTAIETTNVVYSIQYNAFSQETGIYIGNNEIVSKEYFPNNGKLKSIQYGNGDIEEYVYNDRGQLAEIRYTNRSETKTAFTYLYNTDGTLNRFEDHINGDVYLYEYDSKGRMSSFLRYEQDGAVNTFAMEMTYDATGQISTYSYIAQTQLMATAAQYSIGHHLTYDEKGNLTSFQINSNAGVLENEYQYNADFERLSKQILSIYCGSNDSPIDFSITKEYTYLVRDPDILYATNYVSAYALTVRDGSGAVKSTSTYIFTYDANGNITKIVDSEGRVTRYRYDELGQLTREDNPYAGNTFLYQYDDSGNLTQKQIFPYSTYALDPVLGGTSVAYGYASNGWGDQLIAFGGSTITYDANGNPLQYYNGYNFSWANGTELTTAVNGNYSLSFSYDDNGVRVRKTVNGVDHLYTVNGSQIVSEEWGNELLIYLYDASGSPIGMEYRNSTYAPGAYDLFVFETNMFGDITGVYDADGNKLISYTYDAWGNCQTTLHTQNLSGSDYYAQKNPFRYRGYYYDTELGLYYLNARYYDPNTGRFISADSISFLGADGSLIGYNLYAYCDNNPVMYTDPSGHWLETVFDLFSLGVSIVEVVINPYDPLNWAGLAGDALDLIPFVTGIGETVKGVKIVAKGVDIADDAYDTIKIMKVVDLTDDAWDAARGLDRVGDFTQSTMSAGRRIHKGYRVNFPGKEFNKIAGIRLDSFDQVGRTVFELKPYNFNSLRAGVSQLSRYRRIMGKGYIWILELY